VALFLTVLLAVLIALRFDQVLTAIGAAVVLVAILLLAH
jgi:hypothetical protein